MTMPDWQIGAGTAPGFHHWRAYRNNQDAVVVNSRENALVATVCDGCSQGACSEVGAQLMARFFSQRAMTMIQANENNRFWFLAEAADRQVFLNTLLCSGEHYLDSLITGLQGDRTSQIQSMFLFTVLALIITPVVSFVFGMGDGVFQINNDYREIDEHNTPLYFGYRLLPSGLLDLDRDSLVFREHAALPTRQVNTVILASDGALALQQRAGEVLKGGGSVGPLTQFESEARYTRHKNAINRRLNVLNLINRKSHDDMSVVVVKRETSHA